MMLILFFKFFSDTSVCIKLFADNVKLYSSFGSSSVDLQIVCDKLKKRLINGRCEYLITNALCTE